MRRPRIHDCRREDLARAIDVLQQTGQHAHVELFRALMQGIIGLGMITRRETPWDAAALPSGKPTVLLVGDDDYLSTGPTGWRAARGAVSWARAALVHGAGAEPDHYQGAVAAAISCGRMLLVETDSLHVEEWARALTGKPALIVKPRGGVHPIADRAAVMQ